VKKILGVTPEQARDIVAHFGTQREAAKGCGVARSTLQIWLHPKYRAAESVRKARYQQENCARNSARARSRKDRLLAQGLCEDCGKEPLLTTRVCWDCRDKRRDRNFAGKWGVDPSDEGDNEPGARFKPLSDVGREPSP
jgi:hypothetical protein